MKKGLKYLTLLTALVFTGCDFNFGTVDPESKYKEITSISLTPSETTVDVKDQTKKLTVTASGNDVQHSYNEIEFVSDNTSIVTLGTKGEIYPKAVGTTTAFARAKYFSKVESAKVTIYVTSSDNAPYVELNYTSYSLEVGQSVQIRGTVKNYTGTKATTVTYSVSKSDYLSVTSNGTVTAKKAGTANVIATCNLGTPYGSIYATCVITITEPDPTVLNKTNLRYTYEDIAENICYSNMDYCPCLGDANILVVPIWFSNDSSSYISTAKKDNVRQDIITAFSGTTEETGWHSVKTYYETESKGKVNYNVTVADWYNTTNRLSNYTADSGSSTTSLIQAAANAYFNTSGSKTRKQMDGNSNGYIDTVIAVYAAPDYYACSRSGSGYGSNKTNLWAYTYWASNNPSTTNPTMCTYIWQSYDFMYPSSSVANSRTGYNYYCGGGTSTIDAHTYIHEMGHAFGLDDYYDYGDNGIRAAGGFSMQDHNIGGHDPFSVMAYGWASPYIPKTTTTIEINDFQSSHDLILLSPSFNSYNSPFDEYLLLELYTPTGLNQADSQTSYGGYAKGPTIVGIRLWHVDARLIGFIGNSGVVSELFTNPDNSQATGGVYTAFSNTFSTEEGYCGMSYTYLDGSTNKKYSYYNSLLTLIRNSSTSYAPTTSIKNADLFVAGDTFNATDTLFKGQFYDAGKYDGKLDSGLAVGWTFTVNSITNGATSGTYKASITVTKS